MRFRLWLRLIRYQIIDEMSYWVGSSPSQVWGDYLTPLERILEEIDDE